MAAEQPGRGYTGIREQRNGACHVVTIDRGGALNATTVAMIDAIALAYPKLARDPNLYSVILKSADPKAFSAGGDVKALAAMARDDMTAAKAWLQAEYRLNWLAECFSKPTLALIDGIVMGSGVGLSAYCTHRAAGARYRFAMPETAIGFFPDVGTAQFLSRLPHSIGLYLGLTGLPVGRADAFALGLVTHCIDAAHYPDIEAALADAMPIDPLLERLHVDPGRGELMSAAAVIEHCFAAPDVAGIMARLWDAAEAAPEDRIVAGALEAMRARAPLSMAVTLRHLRQSAHLDLRQVLQIDYRLACRLIARSDFHEGVRAALIDRTNDASWRPADIADVTDDMLDDMFAPMPGEELVLPLRQEMQAARV